MILVSADITLDKKEVEMAYLDPLGRHYNIHLLSIKLVQDRLSIDCSFCLTAWYLYFLLCRYNTLIGKDE